jgi:hypothetical protein
MASTARRLATSPAACPPIPSATTVSTPRLASSAGSLGLKHLPLSSFTPRTQPTSVRTLATTS